MRLTSLFNMSTAGALVASAMVSVATANPVLNESTSESESVDDSMIVAQGKKKKSLVAESSSQEYDYPYGMAGCGLGSMIIDENEKWPQVGAAFINGILANYTGISPTFAMTSGTSNCKPDAGSVSAERDVFLRANHANLEKEAAMGDGAALYAFAEVLGCDDTTSKSTFNRVSQERHGEVFTSADSQQVLQNYLNVLRQNDTLVDSCSRLL
jgi:hypothetical protein